MDQSLHELQLAGLHPIVTHPERNPLIRAQPERLYKWLGRGCYAQITAQSLGGKFGKSAQEIAEQWLNAGAVHFIAIDAHNITSRPLRLKETFDRVAAGNGEDIARALLVDNPLAAFEGRPLPYVPDLPEDLITNDSEPQRQRCRKGPKHHTHRGRFFFTPTTTCAVSRPRVKILSVFLDCAPTASACSKLLDRQMRGVYFFLKDEAALSISASAIQENGAMFLYLRFSSAIASTSRSWRSAAASAIRGSIPTSRRDSATSRISAARRFPCSATRLTR